MQASRYEWLTYKEVYDLVLRVGASIRSCGVAQVRLLVPLAIASICLVIDRCIYVLLLRTRTGWTMWDPWRKLLALGYEHAGKSLITL